MANPISNQNPGIPSHKPARAEENSSRQVQNREENTETRPDASQDTVKLSETGVTLNSAETGGKGTSENKIQSHEEALTLAQTIRQQMEDNATPAAALYGKNSATVTSALLQSS
jgi:hypothetical protein